MKTRLSLILAAVLVTVIALPAEVTFATAKPKINPYEKLVDAEKIEITGVTEANASVQVVGGQYEMQPIKADSKGKFSISLKLKQDSKNIFQISAIGKDGKQSAVVTVEITESAEKVKQLEEESGKDLTAPEPPEIEDIESPIDAKTYTIKGTAEIGSSVRISGDDTTVVKVDKKGNFSAEVYLKQNKENSFDLSTVDAAGNVSLPIEVVIEEKSAEEDEDDDEEDTEEKTEIESFPDVKGHWAEEYITKLQEQEVIGGYEDGTFGPNDNITRSALTKVALLAFEIDIGQRVEEKPFDDVPLEAWFVTFVQEAKKQEIVQGFSDNTFRPLDAVNRAGALKILLKASGLEMKNVDTKDNFPDVDPNAWYATYTAFAKKNGVISGYSDDQTFRPDNTITRAEVAKIVIKIQELKAEILATPTI